MKNHPKRLTKAATTRRHFLEQLGALGGSTLIVSAMTSWELMGRPAGPRPVLTGRPSGTKVIVLGAGVSGLTVGYELGKLGYDYRILEARDRVGGVSWSVRKGSEHTEIGGERQVCNFDDGLYINAGPWRIPSTHSGVLGYCKEFGVPLELFINETEASYFYYEGANFGPLANTRVRLREVKADMIGYTSELLAKAADQGKLDVPLTAEDKERLIDFLVEEGYLDSADHVYRATAVRGSGSPYDFKALLQSGFGSQIRSVSPLSGGTSAASIFQPVGGMDQFPKGFQRAIGNGKITFNAEVQSIHQMADHVKIVYLDTKIGKKTEITADYCVSCIPLSVLSGIDVDLSPEMMAAVKATKYSSSAKMGLQMKRRFWEEDDGIFGGHLYSNLPIGDFAYPSNGYFTQKGVLLGLYDNGRLADLVKLPVRERIEHVLRHSSKVHPQMRQEFESAYGVWWQKVKYSQGGYAVGGSADRRAQLNKPDRRVYLGCAALALPEWQESAISAAWSALKALHERVMRA